MSDKPGCTISKVVSSCYHQLRRIRQVRRRVGQDVAQQLVFSIYSNATRLLQLTVVSSARVNYSASAACDECSGSSHNEFVAARPCEISIETVTLAAGWAKNNYLQAMSVYALHPHRTSTKIHFRLFPQFLQPIADTNGRYRLRSTGSLSGLRSAKNKNKIRWTWLLLLRSSRL